jgi:Flp pilus assembly protein protease CpaA
VSRPATDVAHWTYPTHAGGKSVEQLSIERLVLQLIKDAPSVFVSNQVVASLVGIAFVSVHLQLVQRCTIAYRVTTGLLALECKVGGVMGARALKLLSMAEKIGHLIYFLGALAGRAWHAAFV